MTDAVEELYAHIIRFLIRAYDWYREGTLRHIVHSITRPADLRYHDLLENIEAGSRNIEPSLGLKWSCDKCTRS
jgi:hypothetical protein